MQTIIDLINKWSDGTQAIVAITAIFVIYLITRCAMKSIVTLFWGYPEPPKQQSPQKQIYIPQPAPKPQTPKQPLTWEDLLNNELAGLKELLREEQISPRDYQTLRNEAIENLKPKPDVKPSEPKAQEKTPPEASTGGVA